MRNMYRVGQCCVGKTQVTLDLKHYRDNHLIFMSYRVHSVYSLHTHITKKRGVVALWLEHVPDQ